MSFIDDVDSLKTKLHLQEIPVPLRVGLVVLGAALLFILFQGLWQLGFSDSHLIAGSNQGPDQAQRSDGLVVSSEGDADGSEVATEPAGTVSVHIVGAVKNPGLYEVDEGSRIQEVVSAAGGMTGDAVEGSVNLARVVQDGEQVVVASKSDATTSSSSGAASSGATAGGGTTGGNAIASTGLVNINTADVAALTTLSGIGESTAKKIVADREQNGPFKNKKDITRVSGIGDKKYEAIKDSITV